MISQIIRYFPVVHKTIAKICKIHYVLSQSAVPVCLAPNGTVATNGVITLGTALPTTYSGGIWLRLPAGAVSGGSAGLYWAVMSSTTQGQVYTNFADPASEFIPRIPTGALVAAVGSNVAYTQSTASVITMVNVRVPGGSMGPNGALRFSFRSSVINNANSKTVTALYGGSTAGILNSVASVAQAGFTCTGRNRGVPDRQVWPGLNNDSGASAVSNTITSVNSANDQSFVFGFNNSTATDYQILEGFTIEVLPS